MPIEVTNQMKCLKSQTVTINSLLYYDALHILCSVENWSYILPKFSRLARLKDLKCARWMLNPFRHKHGARPASQSLGHWGPIVSLLAHHSERLFRIAHLNILRQHERSPSRDKHTPTYVRWPLRNGCGKTTSLARGIFARAKYYMYNINIYIY